ncbi:MAG: HAD-IC family P-type ATPase [Mycobacteriales bacterium]
MDTAQEPLLGLSAAEVEAHRLAGHVNAYEQSTSRSVSAIVRANVVTRFNAILGGLLVVILVVGPLQDALFGLVLVSNTAIGIVQELRAKRALDRLAVVTAPRARALRDGQVTDIPAAEVVSEDVLVLAAGDQVVVDGRVLGADGLEVDESLLTGESDPVLKGVGDLLLSGSFVVAGGGTARTTAVGADAYGAQLALEARRFTLFHSELQGGINAILRAITWVMLPTAVLLAWSQLYRSSNLRDATRGAVAGTVTMIPEGLVLLTSIAFAVGVLRLARRQVLVQELPAIEGLARVDTLCIDKTGTLTTGRLSLAEVVPLSNELPVDAALAALVSAEVDPNPTMAAIAAGGGPQPAWQAVAHWRFSSARKWSGADFGERGAWLLGAPEVLLAQSATPDGAEVLARVEAATRSGGRVLLLAAAQAGAEDPLPTARPAALVLLRDEVRPDAEQTLGYLLAEGVQVKVLSGDHPATVGAIARQLGLPGAEHPVDARGLDASDLPGLQHALADGSVFGRVTPQQKRAMVTALQAAGHVVAMTGDGVNDALALKEADLGIAMRSGAPATRAVAQVVLLDSAFSAVPRIVGEGRRVIANVERVANLFLTKTVYATLLALAIGVARLPFPFLPRHLTLVSALTIGIPGFFLALAPNARRARPGFVGRVLRFAVPAGLVAAAATFLTYVLVRSEPEADLEMARTTTVMALFGVALWVLAILSRPATPARQWLVVAMAAAFVVVLAVPATREFFAIPLPRPLLWLAAVGVVALSGLALESGWRAAGWMSGRGLLPGGDDRTEEG